MFAYLIGTEGFPSIVETDTLSLDFLQSQVGGFIERPSFFPMAGTSVYVNEEGLLKSMEPNVLLTLMCGAPLVGPAIIVGEGEDGEDIGLTIDQINSLTHFSVFVTISNADLIEVRGVPSRNN